VKHLIAVKSAQELQKYAADLALKHNDDVNGAENLSEVKSFKCQCSATFYLFIEIK